MELLADFLTSDFLGKSVWLWLAFLVIVGALLAFDLGVLHKQDKELGVAESLNLSAFYIAIALVFGAWLWWSMGPTSGMEYFTGYALEKALSIDNVFVISLIFSYFAIPAKYQYRALLWGIIAVLVLRGIMIGLGAALVQQYEWVLYIFGAFLIATGIKILVIGESEQRRVEESDRALPVQAHARLDRAARFALLRPQARSGDGQARALRDAPVPGAGR